jgi:hypothetical protein
MASAERAAISSGGIAGVGVALGAGSPPLQASKCNDSNKMMRKVLR